tara:strand:+ start:70 stop:531 length:462 start_codon:yes stop_codon:yes gene_type:complete
MLYDEDFKENDPMEELKRADHLIYVTLRYTRTCDVVKNALTRLINAYNFVIFKALEKMEKEGKIKEIPGSPNARFEMFRKLYRKRGSKEYFDLYILMKQINGADYDVREEYRKNVTLIAHFGNKDFEVTAPLLLEYFYKTKEFVVSIMEWMGE